MPALEKLYKQEPESLPFRQPVDPIVLQIPVSSKKIIIVSSMTDNLYHLCVNPLYRSIHFFSVPCSLNFRTILTSSRIRWTCQLSESAWTLASTLTPGNMLTTYGSCSVMPGSTIERTRGCTSIAQRCKHQLIDMTSCTCTFIFGSPTFRRMSVFVLFVRNVFCCLNSCRKFLKPKLMV